MFLTYGSYESHWWAYFEDECSPEEIAEVLQFSLAALHFHIPSRSNLFYTFCYDATVALAYALHEVVEDVHIDDTLWNADRYFGLECGLLTNYLTMCRSSAKMSLLIKNHLRTTNFTGVSVSYKYTCRLQNSS